MRSLTYKGSVLSIEDLPDRNSSKANFKYWFVSYDAMEPFLHIDNIDDWSNAFSIKVEVIKKKKRTKRS